MTKRQRDTRNGTHRGGERETVERKNVVCDGTDGRLYVYSTCLSTTSTYKYWLNLFVVAHSVNIIRRSLSVDAVHRSICGKQNAHHTPSLLILISFHFVSPTFVGVCTRLLLVHNKIGNSFFCSSITFSVHHQRPKRQINDCKMISIRMGALGPCIFCIHISLQQILATHVRPNEKLSLFSVGLCAETCFGSPKCGQQMSNGNGLTLWRCVCVHVNVVQ